MAPGRRTDRGGLRPGHVERGARSARVRSPDDTQEGTDMVRRLARIRDSSRFQNLITLVIIAAGALVGVETYPAMREAHGGVLHLLDQVVLWIFVAEVVVKMGAEGSRPWRYFRDPWNVFDFFVVAASFMPVGGQTVVVLRLVRLLRVLKLVRALPKLQLLVSALLKSIPSMAYVSVLLFLLFYVYGVAAVFLFGENDPVHFGSLQLALLSLFRTVTLAGWESLMYTQMHGCAAYGYESMPALCTDSLAQPLVAPAFFVSFVLLGTMIILNLFIGVIMSGMDEAHREADDEVRAQARRAAGETELPISHELAALHRQLAELQEAVGNAQRRALREEQRRTDPNAPPMPVVLD